MYVPYFKMQEHVYKGYGNQIFEFLQFICLGSLADYIEDFLQKFFDEIPRS